MYFIWYVETGSDDLQLFKTHSTLHVQLTMTEGYL